MLGNKGLKNFSFCILNSLSFSEKSTPLLEQDDAIHLYQDNGKAGIKTASYARSLDEKYYDKSWLYKTTKIQMTG